MFSTPDLKVPTLTLIVESLGLSTILCGPVYVCNNPVGFSFLMYTCVAVSVVVGMYTFLGLLWLEVGTPGTSVARQLQDVTLGHGALLRLAKDEGRLPVDPVRRGRVLGPTCWYWSPSRVGGRRAY